MLMQRIQVVLGSIVTLAVALAAAVNSTVGLIAPALPDGWQDNAFRAAGAVVAVLGSAVLAIRRVTEVPPAERGLLPRPESDPFPPTSAWWQAPDE